MGLLNRGSVTEHVLHFKCHRKYYNVSATKNTNYTFSVTLASREKKFKMYTFSKRGLCQPESLHKKNLKKITKLETMIFKAGDQNNSFNAEIFEI